MKTIQTTQITQDAQSPQDTKNTRTIYLIRHGSLQKEAVKRYIGQREIPLSEEGRTQLAGVAKYLADKQIGRLICSPLGRCVESAQIIAARLPNPPTIEREPAFIEINLGAWEGQEVAAIKQHSHAQYIARGQNFSNFRPPGGESFIDLQKRAWPALLKHLKQVRQITQVKRCQAPGESGDFQHSPDPQPERANRNITIVAHAGVNRVLISAILSRSLDDLFSIQQDYGCINILHCTGEEGKEEELSFRETLSQPLPAIRSIPHKLDTTARNTG